MQLKKTNDIHTATIEYGANSNFEKWVFFCSDVHMDSTEFDKSLWRSHLAQAKERDAQIFIFGDYFDGMGGDKDPRTSKGSLKANQALTKMGYINEIIKEGVDNLREADVAFISPGNHELSVLSHLEVGLHNFLASEIGCELGEYDGFIRFSFSRDGSGGRTINLYYNHGAGGSSPVTHGVIGTNRRQVAIDADIFVTGHNHRGFQLEMPMLSINKTGNLVTKEKTHINLGTYKTQGDWERQKGFALPVMGGTFIRFYWDHRSQNIKYDVIKAK